VYAIVECGGRQYRAEEGNSLVVEKLPYEVGKQVELEKVLLVSDGDDVTVGQPRVDDALVKATVIEQFRGKKILVWKYRPRKRYRKRQGHRQSYTRLRIDEIVTG
jgi:large subunit ribosomal protein L21